MAGEKTRKRILDVAERHFADHGFAATSLRRILADAKVNVAAIHYHFGNKEKLFAHVIERRMHLLNEERIEALDAAMKKAGKRKVKLEAIIEAFIRPLFELACHGWHGPAWRKLICRYRLEPGSHWNCVEPLIEEMVDRFMIAFRKVLPKLPDNEIAYRFHLLGGTAVDALSDLRSPQWLEKDLPKIEKDQAEVLARVVAFTAAGMRANLPTS